MMTNQITFNFRRRLQLFVAICVAVFAVGLFAGLLPATHVSAIDPLAPACQGAGASSEACGGGDTNPLVGEEGVITRVTTILSVVVAVIAVIVIILAGLKYIMSGGNPGEMQQARDSIIYAGVALGVAALAQAIVAFVLSSVN